MAERDEDDISPADSPPESGDATSDNGRQGEADASQRSDAPPPPPQYEEVTLADLLEVLWRRRTLVVATFAIIFLGSIAVTALQDPVYESKATLVPTHEKEVLVEVLNSQAFAEDVAREANMLAQFEGNATLAGHAVLARMDARLGSGQIGDESKAIITITATGPTARTAWGLAWDTVETLEEWRPYLRNVTADKVWKQYYEEAGKNATAAQQQVEGYVRGLGFYEGLDDPELPGGAVSPDWKLNLALGAVLGVMMALFLPFVLESVTQAWREMGRGPSTF